jgi:7 transmembrane receptor (rhodopsin family).
MNPLWHGILGFVIGVLGFISVVGNGMVIYIFSTTKPLRTPSNLLVVNLAFSDFLMMLAMSPAMVINCYYETWVLGELSMILNISKFPSILCLEKCKLNFKFRKSDIY